MRTIGRVLSEPIFHFAVVGALLFGADAWLSRREPQARPIRLTDEVREELSDSFEHRKGRKPSLAELERASERWLEDEVLYREGLALGLAGDDVLIRNRVIDKMRFLLSNAAPVGEPSDDELRAWLEEHRADYERPRRYDFEHVEVLGDSEMEQREDSRRLIAQLAAGLAAESLGARHRVYEGRSAANVTAIFGESVEADLAALPLDTWHVVEQDSAAPAGSQTASGRAVSEQTGVHLFRVLRVEQGGAPELEELRPELTADWKRHQQERATRQRLDQMRSSYGVAAGGA